MRLVVFTAFAVACVLSLPFHSVAADSPLAKAAVGDWVEFKGTAPSLGGLVKSPTTLTIRFTVKAKTDKSATLTAKSWAGEHEQPEREIEVPLDVPFDPSKLTPGVSDKVTVTVEKTIPNLKYKIKAKEFTGTAYQYKVAIDLFGGLLPGGPGEADKGKPLETSLAYFVTPEAPVLGIALFTVKGITSVKYELSDGTGVGPLLYPPPPPKGLAYKVGDWLEYRGKNEKDDREIVLRYTVKAIEGEQTTLTADISVDGAKTDSSEIVLPRKSVLTLVPQWKEFGDISPVGSNGSVKAKFDILDDIRLSGTKESREFLIKDGDKREKAWITFGEAAIPLTGLASLEFQNNRGIRVELLLDKHSGFVNVKGEPKPRTGPSRTKAPPNSKSKDK